MTTWLRVGVEGNEQEQNSLDKPQRPFFLIKMFSDQSYTGYWYFGNWLQINSQQQHTQYTLSTNDRQLPCGYKPCPVAHDNICLPPNNQVMIQVYYLSILVQYRAQGTVQVVLQYIFILCSKCLCLQISGTPPLGPLPYHMLGS